MFKKLLSNLPFDHRLASQAEAYGRQLRAETRRRRLGFGLLALAFAVQLAVIFQPLKPRAIQAGPSGALTPPKGLKLSKSVQNVTRDVWNANGSLARPGDVLEFTLTTKNAGAVAVGGYQAEDYFGRVLQYAELEGGLKSQGLSLAKDNYVRWRSPALAPGGSSVKTVRVKVKPVIDTAARPAANSRDYDCTISNYYGELVVVKVPCPLPKMLADSVQALPRASSTSALGLGAGTLFVAGFLSARSALMRREIQLALGSYKDGENK